MFKYDYGFGLSNSLIMNSEWFLRSDPKYISYSLWIKIFGDFWQKKWYLRKTDQNVMFLLRDQFHIRLAVKWQRVFGKFQLESYWYIDLKVSFLNIDLCSLKIVQKGDLCSALYIFDSFSIFFIFDLIKKPIFRFKYLFNRTL